MRCVAERVDQTWQSRRWWTQDSHKSQWIFSVYTHREREREREREEGHHRIQSNNHHVHKFKSCINAHLHTLDFCFRKYLANTYTHASDNFAYERDSFWFLDLSNDATPDIFRVWWGVPNAERVRPKHRYLLLNTIHLRHALQWSGGHMTIMWCSCDCHVIILLGMCHISLIKSVLPPGEIHVRGISCHHVCTYM